MQLSVFKYCILVCFIVNGYFNVAHASGIQGSPLSIYENNFLLGGLENSPYADHYSLKFQISAKLNILQSPLYLAYTQRSFMDLGSYSIPFYDHNFRPEIFYVFHLDQKSWVQAVQIGLSHHSNGKDGDDSRSWNNAYLMLYLEKNGFYFHPKVWLPFLIAIENRDLLRYYGYSQSTVGYIWSNNIEASATVNVGRAFDKYSIETVFTVPSGLMFKKFKDTMISSFWLQTFWGYGESLLGYKDRTGSMGLGIGIRS